MFDQFLFENPFYNFLLGGITMACIASSTYFIRRRIMATPLQKPKPSLTPLEELNEEFRRQYRQACDDFWHSATTDGSVFIGKGRSLALFHHGVRTKNRSIVPQGYNDLKNIAHIPLGIYILFKNGASTLFNDTFEKYWQHLSNLPVPDSINPQEVPYARRIITASVDLLQEARDNSHSIDENRLTVFCRSLANDLYALLNAAAIAQLNMMHEVVQGLLNECNIDRNDPSLKVLLVGARTARQNNLYTTYFERLLGDERKRNIAYIEEFFTDEPKAISIFSTWFFDEKLSSTFFDDIDKMHHDLLMSKEVRQWIEQLIPL